MSFTKRDYSALSVALSASAPKELRTNNAVFAQHMRDCIAVADAIQQRKTGGQFDRARFLQDCGLQESRERP